MPVRFPLFNAFLSPTPPQNPLVGTIWLDSSSYPYTGKIYNGSNWVEILSAVKAQATPPSNPSQGMLWLDTSSLPYRLFVYYGTGWNLIGPLNDSEFLTQLLRVDGSGSGLDADLLDGKNSATTATANAIVASNELGKIDAGWLPVGEGSNIDADKVDGKHANGFWNSVIFAASGVSDVGRALDFHESSVDTKDYNPRLERNSFRELKISYVNRSGSPFSESVVSKNLSYMEINVDNDNGSDETGDGSSTAPYKTVSKALASIANYLDASITIKLLGNANYGVVEIPVFIGPKQLYIRGDFTILDTGSITSYSYSVSDPEYGALGMTAARLNDTSKSWVTNAYKNKIVIMEKGSSAIYGYITYNDDKNLYIASGELGIDNTWTYKIVDPITKISGIKAYGALLDVLILSFLKIETQTSDYVIDINSVNKLSLSRMYLSGYSTSKGLINSNNCNILINQSYVDASSISANPGLILANDNGPSSLLINGSVLVSSSNNLIYTLPGSHNIVLMNGTRVFYSTVNPNYALSVGFTNVHLKKAYYTNPVLFACGSSAAIKTDQGSVISDNNSYVINTSICGKLIYREPIRNLNIYGPYILQPKNITLSDANYVYEVAETDVLIFATITRTAGGNVILPAVNATDYGRVITIKKLSTPICNVSVAGSGTIDGVTTFTISSIYECVTFVRGNTEWNIIADNT